MSAQALSSTATILGPPIGYTDLLDFEIEEKLKREEEDRKAGKVRHHPLRPSAAGYCGRRLAYDLMEYRGHAYYPKEIKKPSVYRLLELGHSVEYSALKNFELLKEHTRLKYKQQTLSFFPLERGIKDAPKEMIEGSCDAVFISDRWKGVMDVKSQKDGWSTAYASRWDETLAKFDRMKTLTKLSESAWYADDLGAFLEELGDDLLADNLYQLNMYACSQFLQERGISFGSILKYNKNDSRQYELRFRPSVEIYEKTRAKFNAIAVAVDEKKPEKIERESLLGSMRCAFCPYAQQCWETADAKKAWFGTLPKKTWPKDLHKMGEDGQKLSELFATYRAQLDSAKDSEATEKSIIEILARQRIKKIRLDDGAVYEVKYLQSPRPHFELRRGKA